MSKIIEKFIYSQNPPKSTNVAWYDGENLKFYSGGKWKSANSDTSNVSKSKLGWWEPQLKHTKIATLSRVNSVASGHSFQGATIYKNMLFAAMNNNGEILVYDLNANAQIGSIVVPEMTDHHNNNINFGSEFYSKKDEFPLLYMSQESNDVHKCLVARITRDTNNWHFEIVQNITFPTPQENKMWWANSYIDAENNYIYLMGYKNQSWTDGSNGNSLVYRRWPLPKLSEGDVTLKVSNSSNYREIPYWTATQGAIFKEGKLYQVYGTPTYKDWIKMRILDMENGTVEHVLEMYTRGFTTEPEGIGYYNGCFYVVDVSGNIFKLEFVEEPLRDTYDPIPSNYVLKLTEEELNEVMFANTKYGTTKSTQGSLDSYASGINVDRIKIYINDAFKYDPKGIVVNCDNMPAGMKYGVTLFPDNVTQISQMTASNTVYDSGDIIGGWSTTTTSFDFTNVNKQWVRFQATIAKSNNTAFTEEEYNAVVAWWKESVRFTTEKPEGSI